MEITYNIEAYLKELEAQCTHILKDYIPEDGESVKGTDTKTKGNLKLATVDGRNV